MPAHVFFQLEPSPGPASEFSFKFLTLSLKQEKHIMQRLKALK